MRERALHVLTSLLLHALFFAMCLVWATLPWLLDWYLALFMDAYIAHEAYRGFILVFLMVAGAGALWILGELIYIFRTLERNVFVLRNVLALRRIAAAAMGIAALFALKSIFFFTPMTLVCSLVFLFCSLLVFVLGGVFAKAVSYKQENDLTI